MTPADVFRAITAAAGGLTIGSVLVVAIMYALVIPKRRNGQRLLPSHVAVIGVSYIQLAMGMMLVLDDRRGQPLVWYIAPLAFGGFTTGIAAMWFLVRHIRRRRLGDPALTRGALGDKPPPEAMP